MSQKVSQPTGPDGDWLEAMLAVVPRLAEDGVTDFRTFLRVPREYDAAHDMLAELAGHFAEVTARLA